MVVKSMVVKVAAVKSMVMKVAAVKSMAVKVAAVCSTTEREVEMEEKMKTEYLVIGACVEASTSFVAV